MGIWRRLERISHNGAILIHSFEIFLNGALHWLAGKYYYSPSVVVNLTDEKFFKVPIPTITTTSLLRFYGIVALQGCLYVLGDRRNENEIDIWMMKEYGVVESWTKVSVVKITFPFCPTPVCLMSDDDIILAAPGKAKLIIYSKKKEQLREMNANGKTSKKLPDEMIEEIVSWMPVKSVGQFRCVSRHWRSFLSDLKFIKAYLNYQSNKHEKFKLILISGVSQSRHSLHINPNPQNGIDAISTELSFHEKWKKIIGSCNGLVLVLDEEDAAFLINPTILEYYRISNSPLALPKHGTSIAYALGYDFSSDDYKVITLSCYRGVLEGDLLCTYVDVSARMGFWRRLERISHNGAIPIHGFGVFLNGALHWLAGKYYCSTSIIVAFNLTDEKFLEVPIPTITTTSLLHFYGIVALKWCLCVMGDRRNENEIDVWMMKEYGVVESWTKFIVVKNAFPFCPTPVCLMSDDDIILVAPGKAKLIIYNKKKEQQREMNVDGKTSECIRTRTFMESLVSSMICRETEGSDYIT
ncbi:hypothetical protein H5410_003734 [Solanum commersonii]|uniref:F-box domain-containing protein n=1 Tax=Solanum commersonii TaxID=4109 RepID=A0A9J6B5R6_SOLCO|nr:hypothetical protein H5410_003734 [Solanum commersonii]